MALSNQVFEMQDPEVYAVCSKKAPKALNALQRDIYVPDNNIILPRSHAVNIGQAHVHGQPLSDG